MDSVLWLLQCTGLVVLAVIGVGIVLYFWAWCVGTGIYRAAGIRDVSGTTVEAVSRVYPDMIKSAMGTDRSDRCYRGTDDLYSEIA